MRAQRVYYVYDRGGMLLGQYEANGRPIQETVYLDGMPVAVLQAPDRNARNTNIFYAYPDHLGSARVITRATNGKMVWRWDQADPFGMFAPQEKHGASGAFVYDPRFPGQVYDRETNTHYNYFRDYDPQSGRYIETDPVGLAGGINTYTYVKNDPLRYTDSTGAAPDQWWRPCNASQQEACVAQCESAGQEFESCAVRWMKGDGVKKPWAAPPSNGGLSCSCKEKKKHEEKSYCTSNPKTCAAGAALVLGACVILAPEVTIPGLVVGGAAAQ